MKITHIVEGSRPQKPKPYNSNPVAKNIDKFNNIIRKFSEESQFILVTHNKRTMSTTDIIYGVTMLEAGVSRLVPVDLRSLA